VQEELANRDSVSAARIRYEQTLRTLDRQAAVLSELRSRASIVLTATGIIASLFGSRALGLDAPGWLKGLALAAVALGLLACIFVLLPVHDGGPMPADPRHPRKRFGEDRPRRWKVSPTIKELDAAVALESEVAILESIVAKLIPARLLNYRTLKERSRALEWAGVLLLMQVLAWSAVLLRAK
jgi:hypothetical protein